ncbi:MAG: RDD family protein [Bacilli bacterium]|nr:RDD family protein [Bacilli bacterium]
MKQNIIFKRLMAFMIDMLIVSLIVSLVLTGKDTSINEKRSRELMKVINDYSSEKITMDEYLDKYSGILYEINEDNYNENVVYLIVSIGYFLVFQYLNKGATIGKSLMKIRIVAKKKKTVSLWQLLIRVSLVNEILAMVLLLLLVKTSSGIPFLIGYGLVSLARNIIVVVCGIVMFIRKDNKGIHDIISDSEVIYDK